MRLLCATSVGTPSAVQGGLLTRLRAFAGGFILASSASFYLLYFQLQPLNDEVRLAVGEVRQRQAEIERKLSE